MNKLVSLGAVMAITSVSFSAYSAGHPNTGCGLGAEVIKNQDTTLMQVFAATTNSTSGNQTFGITSGTLGCDKPASFVSNETHKFVAQNMDSLATEIAMGQGEKLDTLAVLMDIEDKSAFATKLQQNFTSIYTDSDVTSAQVIDNILTIAG